MNLEKLQDETARLQLEVERRQSNWETFLRRFFVAVIYQTLVLLILIFFFFASLKIILTIAVAFLLWEVGNGATLWLEVKAARKSLQNWKQVINSAEQTAE
jgi:predicted MFS family arabinose efflux permease